MLYFIDMRPVDLSGARWNRQNTNWKKNLPHNRTRTHNLEILARCSSNWATKVTFILTCTSDANVYIGISSIIMKKSVFCLVHYCFVLHMGIYLYLTNSKETQKPCICFQHTNTHKHSSRSGIMFGRVLHVASNNRTCSTLCYLSNIIYIQICNTKHYMYKTKYALLNHSRTYTNVWIHFVSALSGITFQFYNTCILFDVGPLTRMQYLKWAKIMVHTDFKMVFPIE